MQRIKLVGVVHLPDNPAFDPVTQVVSHHSCDADHEMRKLEVSVRLWPVSLGHVEEFPESDTSLAE